MHDERSESSPQKESSVGPPLWRKFAKTGCRFNLAIRFVFIGTRRAIHFRVTWDDISLFSITRFIAEEQTQPNASRETKGIFSWTNEGFKQLNGTLPYGPMNPPKIKLITFKRWEHCCLTALEMLSANKLSKLIEWIHFLYSREIIMI